MGPPPARARARSERTVEDMRVHEQTFPALKRRVTAIKSVPLTPRPVTMQPEPPAPPAPPTPGPRDDQVVIPYHAVILPVLGSLLLTICWGYELYLSTPSLQRLVNSFCAFR